MYTIALNPSDPFSTDWAVHLTSPFANPRGRYRWASVADFNWTSTNAAPGAWGPLGSENTSVFTVGALLEVEDGLADPTKTCLPYFKALAKPIVGPELGVPNGAWLPQNLPPVTLLSSVGKSLPMEIDQTKFPHLLVYLANMDSVDPATKTTDLAKQALPNGLNFKGARKF